MNTDTGNRNLPVTAIFPASNTRPVQCFLMLSMCPSRLNSTNSRRFALLYDSQPASNVLQHPMPLSHPMASQLSIYQVGDVQANVAVQTGDVTK